MVGRSADQLRGTDFLDSFPAREHAAVLRRMADRFGDGPIPFTCVMFGSDGTEREIVCSVFPLEVSGSGGWGATFRDLTGPRVARRTAVALAQTAAQLVTDGTSIDEMLAGLARHAVDGMRALACGIVAFDKDRLTTLAAGGYGPWGAECGDTRGRGYDALADIPADLLTDAFSAGAIALGRPPGQPVVLVDAVSVWANNPVLAGFLVTDMVEERRGCCVCIPLSWRSRVFGFVSIYLPPDTSGPSEEELAFYTALADQAAVAVTNAQLSVLARHAAAEAERTRLARELHDSVSQALFSMTMHARAAQLSMVRAGLDATEPLGRSVEHLAGLAQGALAEMRSLILELRQETLAEHGLVDALTDKAAELGEREHVRIAVHGPGRRFDLDPGTEEHLYRIAVEALHNAIKHADADSITIVISEGDGTVTLSVADNGAGFDPEAAQPGHLGLSTMSERAASIGGDLRLFSSREAGTTVVVSARSGCTV